MQLARRAKPFRLFLSLGLVLLTGGIIVGAWLLDATRPVGASHWGGAAWSDCSQWLYVANEGNGMGGSTVAKIDCNGHSISTFAHTLPSGGVLNGPSGLASDADFIYFSDDTPGLFRVAINGNINAINVTSPVPLLNPNGLAVDSSGRLLIADVDAGLIRRLEIDQYGIVTADDILATGYQDPQAVVEVTSTGDVLFIDVSGNINKWSSGGSLPPEPLAVGAVAPANQGSLALDSSGNIYASDFSTRIVRVNPAGTEVRTVVDVPDIPCNPSQAGNDQPSFRGMAFTPDGDLLVTGYCLDNLYIFSSSDLDMAWSSNTPISALPVPVFGENPGSTLDQPYLNGPFGVAFFGDVEIASPEPCNFPPDGSPTTYVDVNGAGVTQDGTVQFPYLTIQDGVDASNPGTIIQVAPGAYTENVNIATDNLRLSGTGPATSRISGLTSPNTSAINVEDGVHGIVIENFMIFGSTTGISIGRTSERRLIEICNNVFIRNYIGVALANASPRIINNTFIRNSATAILADAPSTGLIRNNLFQFNPVAMDIQTTNSTIDHNLYWNNGVNFQGVGNCSTADGCVFGLDPQINGSYHLANAFSPAVDAGFEYQAPHDDFDPQLRPVGGTLVGFITVDIGADELVWEFVPATPSDPTTDDHADSMDDPSEITVGTMIKGDIGHYGDEDWFEFQAKDRTSYLVEVTGGNLKDSFLELREGSGRRLSADDDSGVELNSRIFHITERAGPLHIVVSSYDQVSTGTYILSVSLASRQPPSIIEVECAFSGDFNGDCQVDHLDLAIIGAGFGLDVMGLTGDEVTSQADLNGDGMIDRLDLAEFIPLYGLQCPSGSRGSWVECKGITRP